MSRSLRRLCGSIAACALLAACEAEPPAPPLPNIVLVLSDSLRAANLPFYGYPRETAPRLAQLADEAIVFEQHLANYPATPFSVSQMFSGRLMSPLLMSFAPSRVPVRELPSDLLILPRELRALGYRTGIVTSHPWFGEDARIREYFDTHTLATKSYEIYAPFEELLPGARRFLDATATDERPFFLYVHSMDTHAPMTFHAGHDAWRESSDASAAVNAYDSEIHYTDQQVGHLIDELEARELLDKTIFVFTSDHGEEFGEMGPGWWNRGHGTTLRRALLHVPLLVRLPKGQHAGRYQPLSKHLDLAPTLLRLANPGYALDAFRLDGRDLSMALYEGAGALEEQPSFSYSWSFWAAHEQGSELHYDQWSNRFTPYRVVPDDRNYPRLEPGAPMPALAVRESELSQRISDAAEELARMQGDADATDDAMIGLPSFVDREQGGVPSLEASAKDDRWHLQPPTLLEARAGEAPGPLVLSMPWVAGRYEVSLRLSGLRVRRGYANRFRVEFLGADNAPIDIDAARIASPYQVALGEQQIGRELRVRFSQPRGNVAISGFVLKRVGSPSEEAPGLTPELEAQLRGLGYVE